ncbi:coiled-coil domain-containing protein 63-like [Argonauta hians]
MSSFQVDQERTNTSQDSDIDRLQKQLRILGNSRRNTIDEIRNIVHKQEVEYRKLKSDNEEVKLQFNLEQNDRHEKADLKTHRNLYQLADEYKNILRKQAETKNIITKLDKEHMAYFHQQLSQNTKLRTEIDIIRQERKTFVKIYGQMLNELNKIHRDKNTKLSDATHFYREREEAQQKIINLQEREKKDFSLHQLDVRRYVQKIYHDDSLQEFISKKTRIHQCQKENRTISQRKEEKHMFTAGQQLEIYDKTVKRIEEIMKLKDIESIISKFKTLEEKNFSLFKYINEQNTENESLIENIRQLHQNISELEEISKNLQTKQQGKLLSIKEKLSKSSQQSEEARHSLKENEKTLNKFSQGLESLYDTLYSTSFNRYYPSNEQRTDKSAIELFLTGIDRIVTKLIQIDQYLESSSKKTRGTSEDIKLIQSTENSWDFLRMVPPNIE